MLLIVLGDPDPLPLCDHFIPNELRIGICIKRIFGWYRYSLAMETSFLKCYLAKRCYTADSSWWPRFFSFYGHFIIRTTKPRFPYANIHNKLTFLVISGLKFIDAEWDGGEGIRAPCSLLGDLVGIALEICVDLLVLDFVLDLRD